MAEVIIKASISEGDNIVIGFDSEKQEIKMEVEPNIELKKDISSN